MISYKLFTSSDSTSLLEVKKLDANFKGEFNSPLLLILIEPCFTSLRTCAAERSFLLGGSWLDFNLPNESLLPPAVLLPLSDNLSAFCSFAILNISLFSFLVLLIVFFFSCGKIAAPFGFFFLIRALSNFSLLDLRPRLDLRPDLINPFNALKH